MNNENSWWYFNEALDKETCNKIKDLTNDEFEKGRVYTSGGFTEDKEDEGSRITDVSWTSEQWLYDLVWPYMETANYNSGWRYDIRSAENMQITRYKEKCFYGFHRDGGGDHFSVHNTPENNFKHGRVRKLSMSILLNDSYEGGKFEISEYDKEKCTISVPEFNKVGSIIVFPSYTEHRVSPVTKGVRYSLVVWFLGPPFK